ncbi:TetR/AcrR family transcriptional regulator [Butyrivibrio sp. MC2013]|uniref:TetR/AcrR family transcriptional regulator n=1 Tax=Butyrivibrio sp. MC2013 TaxID=1280686 RepID=UPI0003FE9D8D|nr:TetR/AcrR family transcriptional regulator [Butyrivibrio sp. MC2013]
MGAKSEHKKKYIVSKARDVFAEKGFKGVTMKDIVDACDISRGGLYLYFSDTAQLFQCVMDAENEESESFENDIPEGDVPVSSMLALFIRQQKKEILRKKGSILQAMIEYYTCNKTPSAENYVKQKFDGVCETIEKLINEGVENSEFECYDPQGCARNMAYVFEGLKLMAVSTGISEAAVDREILYILQGLVPADEYVN